MDGLSVIKGHGISPVLGLNDPETAPQVAAALRAGGLPLLEVTMRAPLAMDCLKAIKAADPDMLVGAGTILHTQQVEQAKAAGADFAMLRVGFRGYGTGALVEDNAFAQNAADAANAGLTVGVYFYSQAVTEEEAAEEARFVVERLRGTTVSGPIAYDLEFYTADEARTDDLTGEQATQNAIAFCDVIRQAGYEPVVYMNLHWAGSMYGMEELAHLPVWLASYGPVPALDRGVTLWQYSESGVVDGIEGPVDLDLWFTKE